MKRPSITKKLSLISCCLAGACMLIQACVPAFEKVLTVNYPYLELTMPLVIALIISAVKMLPFAGVVFWNWQQDTITKNKAMVTVILAPVLYVLGNWLVEWVLIFVVNRMLSVSAMGTYSVFSNVQSVFSLMYLAALVLVCCACAIDLYVLKYHSHSQN